MAKRTPWGGGGGGASGAQRTHAPLPTPAIVRYSINNGLASSAGWSFDGNKAILSNAFDETLLGVRAGAALNPGTAGGQHGREAPCQFARSMPLSWPSFQPHVTTHPIRSQAWDATSWITTYAKANASCTKMLPAGWNIGSNSGRKLLASGALAAPPEGGRAGARALRGDANVGGDVTVPACVLSVADTNGTTGSSNATADVAACTLTPTPLSVLKEREEAALRSILGGSGNQGMKAPIQAAASVPGDYFDKAHDLTRALVSAR